MIKHTAKMLPPLLLAAILTLLPGAPVRADEPEPGALFQNTEPETESFALPSEPGTGAFFQNSKPEREVFVQDTRAAARTLVQTADLETDFAPMMDLPAIAERMTREGYTVRMIDPDISVSTELSLDDGKYEIQLDVPENTFSDRVLFFAKSDVEDDLSDRQMDLLNEWDADSDRHTVAFDMGFLDETGTEIEPDGFVGVRLVTDVRQMLTEQMALADLGIDDTEGIALAVEDHEISVDVMHINEQRYAEDTVELVATTQDDMAELLTPENAECAVTVTDGIATASFATDSFSTIVLSAGTNLASGNTYYLTGNITRNFYAYTGGTINLYLNGYTLTGPGGSTSVIEVGSSTTLNIYDNYNGRTGGKITGGNRDWGGGIGVYSSGVLNFYGGTITGNSAKYGGGIYNNGGTVKMAGGTISSNSASQSGGGILIYSGGLSISGGTISSNSAKWGGGVFIEDNLTVAMTGGTITENTVTNAGGGIYVDAGATLNMSGGTVSSNTAGSGGGIIAYNGVLNLSKGTISGNTANYGGGINIESSGKTSTLSGATISGNTANNYGAGVYVNADSTFRMTSGNIKDNTATTGGGGVHVYNGTVNLTGGTVSGNKAKFGAGMYVEANGKTSTVAGATVSGNTASGSGGGAYIQAGAILAVSSGGIQNNTANYGGGVYLDASVAALSGTGSITGNSAKNSGGGVYVSESGIRAAGAARITGNTASTGKDVYLSDTDGIITINGALSSGFSMGVAKTGTVGTVTSGWSSYMSANPANYFYTDSDNYIIMQREGEARITNRYNSISRSKFLSAKTDLTLSEVTSFSRGTGTIAQVRAKSNVKDIGTEADRIFLWRDGNSAYWWADTDEAYLPEDSSKLFEDMGALVSLNLTGFNSSKVTKMNCLFNNCTSLTSIDLRPLDTSGVKEMDEMFSGCESLAALDVSPLETGNVISMSSMFGGCYALTELDVSMWDTGKVEDMISMFNACTGLRSINLHGLDFSNVKYMATMFCYCNALTELDLSGLDARKVTTMFSMFFGSNHLEQVDFSGFQTRDLMSVDGMFTKCSSLKSIDLSGFNTPYLQNTRYMFFDCTGLTAVDLSGLNTASVTNMESMFSNCSSLKALNLSNFDTSNVTSMHKMFEGCSALEELEIGSFRTTNVTSMAYMFHNCSSLTALDLSDFNTSKVTNMAEMLFLCDGLEWLRIPGGFVCDNAVTTDDKQPELPYQLKYVLDANGETVPRTTTTLDWVEETTTFVSQPTTVQITFHSNGAVLGRQTFRVGTPQQLTTEYEGTVSGFNFYGWAIYASTNGRNYTSGQSVSFTEYTDLYAIYTRPVTFYSGIQKGAVNTRTQYYYGSGARSVSPPAATAPNSTWTFCGWGTGTEPADLDTHSESSWVVEDDTTYYSIFQRTINVVYDGNGASGSVPSTKLEQYYNSYGTISSPSLTLPENGFTVPEGKIFLGWGETPDAVTRYDSGTIYTGSLPGVQDTSTTKKLYAIWESARMFSVTVPAVLPVSVAADGTASVAGDAVIVNYSTDAVRVTDISVQAIPGSGWTYQTTLNPASVPVDTKAFSLTVQPVGEIAKGEQKVVTYNAVIPPQTTALTDANIARVVFTVAWVDIT